MYGPDWGVLHGDGGLVVRHFGRPCCAFHQRTRAATHTTGKPVFRRFRICRRRHHEPPPFPRQRRRRLRPRRGPRRRGGQGTSLVDRVPGRRHVPRTAPKLAPWEVQEPLSQQGPREGPWARPFAQQGRGTAQPQPGAPAAFAGGRGQGAVTARRPATVVGGAPRGGRRRGVEEAPCGGARRQRWRWRWIEAVGG